MANYKAGRNKMTLLDNHLATGTEATYTYTPSLALDLKNTYRQLVVIITGKATAQLVLQMKVNAATDYNYSYLLSVTTTVSSAATDAASQHNLLDNSVLTSGITFQGEATISLNDAADFLTIFSDFSASAVGTHKVHTEVQATATTVTSIEIKTSTSTWIAGTEISTYGILR